MKCGSLKASIAPPAGPTVDLTRAAPTNFQWKQLTEPGGFDYDGWASKTMRAASSEDMMAEAGPARRKDADRNNEQGYYSALHGGMLRIDSDSIEYRSVAARAIQVSLHDVIADSKIEVTRPRRADGDGTPEHV